MLTKRINVPVDKFPLVAGQLKAMGFNQTNLAELSREVGEEITG